MVTIEAKNMEEAMMKVAEFLALEIQNQAKQNLVDSGSIDTGQLLQSSDGTLKKDKDQVSFSFNAPYADFVEYGRDPGARPPFAPIRDWAKRKLGLSDKEADRVAYMICNKIEKSGTEPNPFVRNAIDMVISKYK